MILLWGVRTLVTLMMMFTLSSADFNIPCLNYTDPQYITIRRTPGVPIYTSDASLEPLYNFACLFLEAVQPNKFPIEIASQASRNEQLNISQVVQYEAGYIVCLILAVLYVLIIPIVGGVLAWKFFHRSTAAVSQRSPTPLPQWYKKDLRVITCLSIVAILLLVGVILAFTTNSRTVENMEPSLNHLRKDISYIENVFNSIHQKIDAIIEQFSIPQEEIKRDLQGTGDLIGSIIISTFNTQVNNALYYMARTIQDVSGAQSNLQVIEEKRSSMQERHSYLKSELMQLQNRLRNLRNKCSQGCELLEATDLDTNANYDMIPSLDEQLQHLNFASTLDGVVEQGNSSFYSIPQRCTNQIATNIAGLVADFNNTKDFFQNFSRQFPSFDSLSAGASGLNSILNNYHTDIEYYEYIRWSVSVVFCTLILIIVLLMFAGLVVAVLLTYFPTVYPVYLNEQLRLTAVYLLRMAAGMTFIFSWLFVIMVFITLFFGGNVYTLGCRAWTSGQIFEFLDTQENLFSSLNTIAEFNTTHGTENNYSSTARPATTTTMQTFNTTESANGTQDTLHKLNIKTAEIYHGCKSGRSMFYTMHMNEIFNMDVFLNISMYLESFEFTLQELSIDLDDTALLKDDARQAIQRFRDSELDIINYDGFRLLLGASVVKTDLSVFADNLDSAAQLPENEAIREDMQRDAIFTRSLNAVVQKLNTDRIMMMSNVEALAFISQDYKTNADMSLQTTSQIQASLYSEVPQIVANTSLCVMNKGKQLLRHYVNWVRDVIITQVLDCQWLPVSLSNIYTAACENVIDPWNAFWLCLGWCCALLVPGVIFCIQTTRLFESVSSNKVPFHMPEDIINTDTKLNSYVTMDEMEKFSGDTSEKFDGNKTMDDLKYFKKDENIEKTKS